MMGGQTKSLMNFFQEVYYYQQYESTYVQNTYTKLLNILPKTLN
jgi:hypothetical protein